jgi:hypothetical protein
LPRFERNTAFVQIGKGDFIKKILDSGENTISIYPHGTRIHPDIIGKRTHIDVASALLAGYLAGELAKRIDNVGYERLAGFGAMIAHW